MKTIVFLFTFLFLSTTVNAESDKFYIHCSVKSFIDQLKFIDPLVYNAVKKRTFEGEAHYDGQTGSLCYRVSVYSIGKHTGVSIILLEKEVEYARCNFTFRNSKLQSALVDVFLDEDEYYVHFYVKGSKKLSYYRTGDGKFRDFSSGLFVEHLTKVTPLME